MAPMKAPRLLIVDGHAYAYRAFYAIRHLTSRSGAPTNAIYGFISMLAKMVSRLEPSHCFVAWDGGLARERVAALPAYKENRPPMPPELEQQLAGIDRYLQAANCAAYCHEGVEADDVIATLALRAPRAGLKVVIASADKDFMQLVTPEIGLLNPGDKSDKVWTSEDVVSKTGVQPRQIVDWLSLIGDTVDNIAGVPGVGPKTAADLLNQFESVDALFARIEEVKSSSMRDRLRRAAEVVQRNQGLIRLNENLPGAFSLEEMAVKPADVKQLGVLYEEWGFKKMLAQLDSVDPQQRDLL